MSPLRTLKSAGYRYLPGALKYSGGVAAMPGFEIERVRFQRVMPLELGFAAIQAHLQQLGRPINAFCACELRSPDAFTEASFDAFNQIYAGTLKQWGLFDDGANPVARSNVCPEVDKPQSPGFYAFSYTVPQSGGGNSCVISGLAEARDGDQSYQHRVVRVGEQTEDAMREKAIFVLDKLEARLALFGFGWADVTDTQLYTVHNIHPFLREQIAARHAMPAGLSWHFARPPVDLLDFEMDARRIHRELLYR